MKIDTELILEFFDIDLSWNDDTPRISLSFKDSKKVKPELPRRKESNYVYSPASIEYYYHYIDNKELAEKLYKNRKKLYNKGHLIEWYIDNISDDDACALIDYKEGMLNRIGDGVRKYYKTPAGLRRKETVDRPKARRLIEGNRKRWKDPYWKANEIKRRIDSGQYKKSSITNKKLYSDPDFKKRFHEAANNPIRKKKISIAAKKMWNDIRNNDKEKFKRMILAGKNKFFRLNGFNMNSIEYQIGVVLNELNLDWLYEKLFVINGLSYLPDFYVENHQLIIECYGDFWHAHPDLFTESMYTHRNRKVIDIWKRDNERKLLFESLGYKFLHLWESDINADINNIKNKIQLML